MAKNNLLSGMDAIEAASAKKIINDADLQKTANKKGGRKPKEVKSDQIYRVYTTLEQKYIIDEYCSKTGIPFSTLVKQLLAEKEIL